MDWHEHVRSFPPRLVDILRRRAAETPDKVAASDARGMRSFADLVRGADVLAGRLRDAGVRAGDRVVLVAENRLESVHAFYAVTALDAWAVLVNARLTPPEIDGIAAAAGARLTLYCAGDEPERHSHAREGARRIRDAAFGTLARGPLQESAEPEAVHDDPRRQVAAMIFTSGSTGKPKGVMLTHDALAHQSALSTVERGFTADDRLYVVAPITHIFGFSSMLLAPMYAGAEVLLVPRFEVDAAARAIREGGVTRLYGAPPMFAALVERARRTGESYRGSRLREIVSGGAATDQGLRDAAADAFGMPLGIGYASTEFTPIAGSTSRAPPKPGAIGRAWRANEIRTVDAAGDALPPSEVGEIQVRGACAMLGYYRNEAATREALKPGGWLATGDLGRLDEDGQLHFVGRLKEVIVRSGFKVYPAEVEAALDRHSGIAQSVVVGRPVPGNEEVVAFVQPRQGAALDKGEITRHLRSQLAPYKVPALIEVMDALPVGPTGKVMRRELAELARTLPAAPAHGRATD